MLVLSRHRDESIIIGDDIVITVVDIRGDKVRLGIAAPIEISVHRQEVYEAIQRENRQASRLEPQDARQIERINQPPAATRAELAPKPPENPPGNPHPSPNRSSGSPPTRTYRLRPPTGPARSDTLGTVGLPADLQDVPLPRGNVARTIAPAALSRI